MISVSIIVPVYNSEKYLERCLESLVNQTLENIEIIAVNDASPDNSLSILENFYHSYPDKMKIINLKENLRQGGARNHGLRSSMGKYIGFVDADDWVDLEMFEKLFNLAETSQSDIVDCDYFEAQDFDSVNRIVQSNSSEQIGILDINKKRSLILNSGRMLTKLYKRDLFFTNNIEFQERSSYDDNQIMPILLVSANKLSKIPEPLYYYFTLNESTTRSLNNPLAYDRLTTSVNMIREFKKRNLYDEYEDELVYRFIQLYYFNSILIFINKFNPPERRILLEMKKYIRLNYPSYRKNYYFQNNKNRWFKLITQLNDIHPTILILINNFTKFVLKLFPRKAYVLIKKSILE